LHNGYAYVGNYASAVIAVEIPSGNERWRYENDEAGGAFVSSPAVSEEYLVIGSRDGRAHCLDPADGELLWTYETGAEVDSSPVIAGKKVVFGSSDGRFYCVDLPSGSLIWRYDVGSPITTSAAVTSEVTVFGADDGTVYALTAG